MKLSLLLLFSILPVLAEARETSTSCEELLVQEFRRPPNDFRNGLISTRVPLNVNSLVRAYEQGIFPWGEAHGGNARWHRPPLRGVLFLDEVDIGRSDRKYLRQQQALGELRVTFDQAFERVMRLCAAVPRFQTQPGGIKVPDEPWISPKFIEIYSEMHRLGLAHSVEVWRGEELVGGLYGVFIHGVFTGESMFFLEPNATKLAFQALIERLTDSGHEFIDTQMVLGLARKWGARYVARQDYEKMLREAQEKNREF
ncbi:MAG: leucyl/phenylalanyl-tRNA--protein transferase [Bdellovibrionales bacterium]